MINNKTLFLLVGTLVIYFSSGYTRKTNETLTTTDKSGDWVLLLEGNNLNHWEMYNQREIKGWESIKKPGVN